MERQVVERWQKLTLRQIARSAEHYNGARRVGHFAIVAICSGRFGGFSCTCAHLRSPWRLSESLRLCGELPLTLFSRHALLSDLLLPWLADRLLRICCSACRRFSR